MRRLILVISLGSAGIAAAETRHDADEHARRGVALYNLGKYDEAIDEFEQAYTLFQSDALLFNLAQTHRQLQHCDRAVYYYKRFLAGAPSPMLAAQVENLLPKLEAACRTKYEPPAGPVAGMAASDAPSPPAIESSAAAAPRQIEASNVSVAATPADEPPLIVATGELAAGMLLAGKTAPVTGGRVTVTTPAPWLHAMELGASVGVGELWRGDAAHNAMLAQLAATVRYRIDLAWGHLTLAGEVGGAYVSQLDYSDGVVPGLTTGGEWAPLARAEVGVEHDVAGALALRVAAAAGGSPRTGAFLSAIAELDLLVGVRYAR